MLRPLPNVVVVLVTERKADCRNGSHARPESSEPIRDWLRSRTWIGDSIQEPGKGRYISLSGSLPTAGLGQDRTGNSALRIFAGIA